MKKNLFIAVIGLMSLISMSSCEDYFTYDNEKSFSPIGYDAEIIKEDGDEVSKTLLIKGVQGLVFDKIEKDDWKIITQSEVMFNGNKPLEITRDMIEVNEDEPIIRLATNYDDIPITFGNTAVEYTYLGNKVELPPLEKLQFNVRMEDVKESDVGFYLQVGHLVFRLYVGYVPVQIHKVLFMVADTPTTDLSDNAVNGSDSDE